MSQVISTPSGIEYVRWASIKGRLKLEKVGLKSSGGATRPKIAKELGLKPRDSFDAFIEAIEVKMAGIIEEDSK